MIPGIQPGHVEPRGEDLGHAWLGRAIRRLFPASVYNLHLRWTISGELLLYSFVPSWINIHVGTTSRALRS